MFLREEKVDLDLDLPGGFIFDIETTGLSYRYHRLAMIGYLYQEDGSWILRQELAQSKDEEKLLLLNFMRLSQNFLYTVHYNGQKFDLPFVNYRSKKLGLSSGFDRRRGFDLYLHLRRKKYPGPLGLNDQEKRIGYKRQDKLSGGQWVQQYKNYLENKNTKTLEELLLHNWDDLLGTAALVKSERDFQEEIASSIYKEHLILESYPGLDEIRLELFSRDQTVKILDFEAISLDGMLLSKDFSNDMSAQEKKTRLLAYEKKPFIENIKRELTRLDLDL